MNKRDVVTMIDRTVLKPEAIQADATRIVGEGATASTFSVCVSPLMLPLDVPEGLQITYVAGFPSRAVKPGVKASKAALAVADGVDEIDMIINIGLVKDGRLADLGGEIATARRIVPSPRVLKVVIKTTALTNDEIVAACQASVAVGADSVETSAGFHSTGDASTHAVAPMCATVGEALGVKALDGIRDAETTLAMIEAGASRLGVSATNAILAGLED